MKHLLVSVLAVSGILIPSLGFASLQCTDIFTVREEQVIDSSLSEDSKSAPSEMTLHPVLQSILQTNVMKAREFQMSDVHFMRAPSYEQMTFAIKNKIRIANELIDVVVQNIIFLKFNENLPPAFEAQLSKMSADFLNMVAATWNIKGEQLNMIINIRFNNEMREMQAASERDQARQPYIGFRQPRAETNTSAEKIPMGFGPRKATPDDAVVEKIPMGFGPRKAKTPEDDAPVEKGPMGFIHFAERANQAAQPVEPGFVPRKEAPDNMPKFILVIDAKTGDLDAINPDAKIGY